MTANPPQSRAPPGGPEAQGATSNQASCKLQIRSALSPPAGSGDPPSLPSTPTRLRAAAPLPEGPGPPCRGSPGAASSCPGAAPSLRLFQDKTRAGVVEPKVPSVLTRSLLVSSQGCQARCPQESPAACLWPCAARGRCRGPLCSGWPALGLDPWPGPLATVKGHLLKKSPGFPWSSQTRAVP